MTTINVVAWVIIGLLIGVVSAWLRKSETPGGLLLDLVAGVIGGFIGGVVLNAQGGLFGDEIVGVNLGGALVAIIGAVILLLLWETLRGTPDW